ncbi:hypothetical protein HK103_003241 [Boothiomyces macroporosus]|uniref:Glutamate/phenylalanine/leucine/valine/L-tryptophan dehydrogenase C-terminal domain-containing protein n=1 Tax=Boothiomyces macroporosus TaxID=261099 RepID=A0AAD5ULV5_9FUNG|nr:hypothetical protein HK103_003241 [Boothiomyces macroporosus]
MDLLKKSPTEFIEFLRSNNIQKFYFVTENNKFVASHTVLQPIADVLSDLKISDDYDQHEGYFAQIGPKSGVLQSAAIHKTFRGPGAGGVRNWVYDNMNDFFRDGLRLAKGMGHKNALAGIWWGGGKGLAPTDDAKLRQIAYEEYGEFMTSLHGCYVTAEDVGTNVDDMKAIFSKTRHTTCIPTELGGSGNPSIATARGIIKGLEAAFHHWGKSLKGSTIAVQGAGHVGMPVIHFLFEAGVAKVIASDVDAHRAEAIKKEYTGKNFELHIVDKSDYSILFKDVDAVCPCATGGILNPTTIPQIKAKIICGAANNQLLNMKVDDVLLHNLGKIYVPDFLVNRMGIVNCADEHMGIIDDDPKLDMHLGKDWGNSIFNLTLQVLKESAATGKTSQAIAVALADQRSLEVNPCYGHRSLQIIKWLVKSKEWNQ